ncbi:MULTISPECIES: hypothetical protein [Thiorhodovibrio]|uniref:hypothetical protein n=1 Tax=Thiorhodovibrio TaxID=61593 RepID=UPI0019130E50|nr:MULTISPECIES: hypothetical protein [Thiorhodovibrio]MBK5968782.1 hypothetical protein [Thiorhodovibrio winogradskyi]WPL10860.1 hypothetical protein Thiosp_00580 [Thiorhodovibrio litoralis]
MFELNGSLPDRLPKVIFDNVVAGSLLLATAPVLLLLKLAYLIEGWILPENIGPLFFYYNAVSAGRVFRKYKILHH